MLVLLQEAHQVHQRNKAYCELDDVNQMQFAYGNGKNALYSSSNHGSRIAQQSMHPLLQHLAAYQEPHVGLRRTAWSTIQEQCAPGVFSGFAASKFGGSRKKHRSRLKNST